MKKVEMKIALGWILIVLQVLAIIGGILSDSLTFQSIFGIVGYSLPGIIGLILLIIGYRQKNN